MSTPLLNRTQLRDYAFQMIRETRPGLATKMTRVADSFFEWAESQLRIHVYNDVRTADRSLKTLRATTDEGRSEDLPWLVNQSGLHAFTTGALGGGLTLVGGNYVASCDLYLRRIIKTRISGMSSCGRTVR